MIYSGTAISVQALGDGIAEFKFDLANESVNKFNRATLEDLQSAINAVKADSSIKGMVVTSGKSVFIVGADITEFVSSFAQGEAAIVEWVNSANQIFNSFEDLPFPTVAAINGIALGGGFEMCLVCDYRVASTSAKVGLPEIKLGIFPGFGGTVRLPRVIGIDNAVEWIATGAEKRPDAALKDGAIDAVVAPAQLTEAAVALVKQCIAGKIDWQAKRAEKLNPVKLNMLEQMMSFNTATAMVVSKAGPNYPAPKLLLQAMQGHASLTRDDALKIEAKNFAKAAVTPQANALVGLFMADQAVKKASKKHESKGSKEIKQAAVLGAGIMGGGIAYQAASKGTPIIMKDIRTEALDLGMGEASKLLGKMVEKGRMTPAVMGQTLSRIRPTLNYGDFNTVDIIIDVEADELAMDIPFDNHLVVVDVRKEPEFGEGHVKDAVNLPLNNLVDPGSMADIHDTDNLYVHCAGGYRSMIACSILRRNGFRNVSNVKGGMARIKKETPEWIARAGSM